MHKSVKTLTRTLTKELKVNKVIKTNLLMVDEALLTGVSFTDRISVPTKRTLTDAGQMHVPCKFARTGSQLYTAKQLGLADVSPDKVVTVWRDEADVFNTDSLDSFRSAPVTIGHPKDDKGTAIAITVDNAKELQVGMLEGMPVRDEDTLGGTLILTTKEAITCLDEAQELSAGYTCDIEEVDGKYFQRNIRANHIAIVTAGRAGSSCRISDEAEVLVGDALECAQVALADALVKVEASKELLDAANTKVDALELQVEKDKVELADAIAAGQEDVTERCEVIEQARLISDFRLADIGGKTTAEIRLLVVTDQYPDKDFSTKKESFVEAMFELIADALESGETPMGKLIKTQDTHITIDAKPVDAVAEARNKMVARQSAQSK